MVLLPTRSRTASIRFRSEMRLERSGPSNSMCFAPSDSQLPQGVFFAGCGDNLCAGIYRHIQSCLPERGHRPTDNQFLTLGEFEVTEQSPGCGIRLRYCCKFLSRKV